MNNLKPNIIQTKEHNNLSSHDRLIESHTLIGRLVNTLSTVGRLLQKVTERISDIANKIFTPYHKSTEHKKKQIDGELIKKSPSRSSNQIFKDSSKLNALEKGDFFG